MVWCVSAAHCRSLCLFRHGRVSSFSSQCKSRVIQVEANELVVKRSSERLCVWSRGRFAGIDPRYGSPHFSPEAPRCRQTAVGIRDAIALLNQNICDRAGKRYGGYCRRVRGVHNEMGWEEMVSSTRAKESRDRAAAPPGDIPFRLLQNARTDNGIPYVESTTIHPCHTFATPGQTSFA